MPSPPNYPGDYVGEMPSDVPAIAGVSTAVTAFVGPARRGPVNRPVRVLSVLEFERRFGGLSAAHETGYAVLQYFQNGGREAWVVRVARRPSDAQLEAGLRALDAVDLFNLLVLPGTTHPSGIALAVAYGEKRRAFLLVDPPAGATTLAEIHAGVLGLTPAAKSHAAIYYPWVRISDPLHPGQPRLVPPSGTMAGLFARTDTNRGVWKAPAGLEARLLGVVALDRVLTDADSGPLNARGINCLRSLPHSGFVAWGGRTLAGDDRSPSDFKYIPVRRTALFIEQSVARGTPWAVFEPNDEPLWARLRRCVGEFLDRLFRQGALQGATAREAYFVKCGRDTTTPAGINSGWIDIVIGFAPLKPAEFVILRIRQSAGQTNP